MTNHVLVVDDDARWRKQIHSLLFTAGAWRVCGEASDGRQAIAMADALRPDVILLDIELPLLSGIGAAKAILASNPRTKILFVSAHRSWHIVDAALNTGARGYVLKTWIVNDLLPAIETIVLGGRFISGALTGRTVGTPHTLSQHLSRCHEAGFCSDDTVLVEEYARFVSGVLEVGGAVIFVAEDSRHKAVHHRLEANGVDVRLAIRQGRLASIEVADALPTFLTDGWPNEERFWNGAHSLIGSARRASVAPHSRVAACGDGAASLLRDGRADAAIRLEQLWDDFARVHNVDIFCGYSSRVAREAGAWVYEGLTAAHSAVHSR